MQTAARDLETSMASATQEMQSGVRAVESELNAAAAGTEAGAEAGAAPAAQQTTAPAAAQPAHRAATVEPPAQEAPRQESLPGFERN